MIPFFTFMGDMLHSKQAILDVKNIVGSQRPSMDGAILRPE
jgi:hypothetical protein